MSEKISKILLWRYFCFLKYRQDDISSQIIIIETLKIVLMEQLRKIVNQIDSAKAEHASTLLNLRSKLQIESGTLKKLRQQLQDQLDVVNSTKQCIDDIDKSWRVIGITEEKTIRELLKGNAVVLLMNDCESFNQIDVTDEKDFKLEYFTVYVPFVWQLGGYKWRETLNVELDKDCKLDDIYKSQDGEVNLIDMEYLEECEPDYNHDNVDIDLSEAGSGVYHSEDVEYECIRVSLR